MAKKHWIYVKRGLTESPHHRNQIGNRIWLYLHILDRADWETGIVSDWRDKDEAADMGMQHRTLQQQRQELADLGYITCQQTLHGQNLIVHNWINPRDYGSKVLNPRPASEADEEDSAHGTVHGTVNTVPYGTVHGTVHPYRELRTPSISDQSHRSSDTPEELLSRIDGYLHQKFNGTYAQVQPVIKIDHSPNVITIGVSVPQPALKADIASFITGFTRKRYAVKVVHTPAVTSSADLTAAQRARIPYRLAYEQARGGPVRWESDADEDLDWLISIGCPPAHLADEYRRNAADPYWQGKPVPFKVLVKNYIPPKKSPAATECYT